MSNYNHPYCTIDSLRISKANGIRFIYITDEEGSFFDGENIPDNTPYNEMTNCGFVVPAFQQQIPCGGIARFQFQWCDDQNPLVHVFKNGVFDYELTPTLVLDGTYQIYEQELNFDESFCDSCVEIRICTGVQEWFTAYGTDEEFYNVGNLDTFSSFAFSSGFRSKKVFVTDYDKAVVLAQNNSTARSEVYTYINGVSTNYVGGEIIFVGNFLYALDTDNWVVANNGTSGYIYTCIAGSLSLEAMGISPYVRGVVMSSNGTIYVVTQSPYGTTYIYKRVSSGNWVQEYVFSAEVLYINSDSQIKIDIFEDVLYVPYHFMGEMQVLKYPLATGQPVSLDIASGTTEESISVFNATNIAVCTNRDLYLYDGESFVQDTGISLLRASLPDSTNINSVEFESEDVIRVISGERMYTKINGTWRTGSGGSYTVPNNFLTVSGLENINYSYHAKSEPIIIADDECLKKFEYWNDDDYDYQTFCQGFRNITYVQAQITGFKPMEESEVYVTSNNRKRVISSNLAKLNNLDINYIPEYLHEILWRAFGMTNLEMEDKSYTKNGDYNIEENPTKYALYKANIELYENLYKFANSNCDESC
jgi:hypothetical protein